MPKNRGASRKRMKRGVTDTQTSIAIDDLPALKRFRSFRVELSLDVDYLRLMQEKQSEFLGIFRETPGNRIHNPADHDVLRRRTSEPTGIDDYIADERADPNGSPTFQPPARGGSTRSTSAPNRDVLLIILNVDYLGAEARERTAKQIIILRSSVLGHTQ
jgi:hypothetical protein